MDIGKALSELDKIQASLTALRETLVTPAPEATETVPPAKLKTAESVPAQELGPIPDYDENFSWPMAVSPSIIVEESNDAVKRYRALQIVSECVEIKSPYDVVLDVGCGDGIVAAEIALKAKMTVGYDIKTHAKWPERNQSLLLTSSRDTVERYRYNIILAYDVLDHLEGDEPVKFMKWLGSLLAKDGRIIVRAHPWTSVHGGHLYTKGKNKAFLHLVMTADELAQRGLEVPPGLRIVRPLASYDNIFKGAGLTIVERKTKTDIVDKFFSGDILDRIIKVTWKGNIDHDTALKIMANSFIDYTLTSAGV